MNISGILCWNNIKAVYEKFKEIKYLVALFESGETYLYYELRIYVQIICTAAPNWEFKREKTSTKLLLER